MKPIRPYLLVLLPLAIIVTTLMAAVIKSGPTATPEGNAIAVRWWTDDESGIVRFAVLRSERKADPDPSEIGTMDPRGNGSAYLFEDRSVFKTDNRKFYYTIRVDYQNGSVLSAEAEANYSTSSAARRTWGSIKAMFR